MTGRHPNPVGLTGSRLDVKSCRNLRVRSESEFITPPTGSDAVKRLVLQPLASVSRAYSRRKSWTRSWISRGTTISPSFRIHSVLPQYCRWADPFQPDLAWARTPIEEADASRRFRTVLLEGIAQVRW